MSLGFYLAQAGHVVPLIAPVDVTGGKTSPAFSMAKYAHASIIFSIGVSAAAPTSVVLNACTDAAGSGATAIPFNVHKCEAAPWDVLGAKTAVAATGLVPSATDGIFYVIEIDAQQMPQGYPYLQLVVNNGVNSVIASAVAVLSGARHACDQSPTVLA